MRFVRELQGVVLLGAVALAAATWACWPYVLRALGAGLPVHVAEMTHQLVLGFAPVAAFMVMAGISAARLRSHERHVNSILDSVPAVTTLAWVALASHAGVGPLLWGALIGYGVQAVWLAWLAARADHGFWGRPLLALRSPHWPAVFAAVGVMLVGQVAMSFVGPLDQYAAANLEGNANATLGYAGRILSLVLGVGAARVAGRGGVCIGRG